MPYRVGQIECDTVEEAKALVSAGSVGGNRVKAAKTTRKVSKSQRDGIAQSWRAARALAKKEGISIAEARSKLAKAK